MKYENSWTRPGEGFLKEAVSLKWVETNRDNPQRFETEHKGQKITLEWFKGNSMKKGGTMHIKGNGAPAKEVAQAVGKHFAGQRIITLNGSVFSTKVAGFQDRGPDDYTTYRPGWKKTWNWSA
jgi:hypothetical protein